MKMTNQTQITDGYIYALNMINKSEEGTLNELISEQGNKLHITTPVNYSIIGSVEVPDGRVYVFLQHDTNVGFKIIQNSTNVEVYSGNCFNYSSQRPIKGEFRVTECDEILYWYDGHEPDRFINLTHPEYHNSCESYLLKPEYDIPLVKHAETLNSGGDLKSGSYELFVRYVDNSGNRTDWCIPTEEVYVYDEPYPNVLNPVLTTYNSIVGSSGITQKVIKYNLTNVDTRYKYIETAVCINKGEGYIYEKTPVQSELNVFIRSVNGKVPISYAELITPTAKYKSSKVMVQQDNRLLRANLKEETHDWKMVQRKYANEIQITYSLETVNSQKEIGSNLSLMRDEVYAIGIVYVMKDGSLSPVLHIPGRAKNYYPDGSPIPYDNTDPNTHIRPLPVDGWDSTVYTANADSEHIAGDFERWQVYNTALTGGTCGYFECRDQDNNPILYPEIRDCEDKLIYPNDDGTMLPIRHHRMPDTTLEPHSNYSVINTLSLTATNVILPTEYPDIVGYYLCINNRDFERTILDKGILTGIVERPYNKFVAEDTITSTEYKKGTILHQSLQTSKCNNKPKSYTIETSDEFTFLQGGEQRFLFMPACSETLAYAKEMSEEVDERAGQACKLVGFHSPKSKLDKKVQRGTYMKWEVEELATSNLMKQVFNVRQKYKNKESDKLIHTEVGLRIVNLNRPSLTSRNIVQTSFVDADITYDSINSGFTFVNKTQQEIGLVELSSSTDVSCGSFVKDSESDFPDNTIDDKIGWCSPNIYTKAEQYFTDVPEDVLESASMSYNYVSIKQHIPDIHKSLENIKYTIASNFNERSVRGDSYICRFAFRQTFYGYVPHAGNWNKDTNVSGDNIRFVFGQSKESPLVWDIDGNYLDMGEKYNSCWESVLIDGYYESDINIDYREEGTEAYYQENELSEENAEDFVSYNPVYYQKIYPKSYNNPEDFLMLELNSNAVSRLTDDGLWTKFTLFPNYYKLQPYYNNMRKYPAFPVEYKPCDDCEGMYPNRLIWSERTYYDHDTYRTYQVNNFRDIYTNSKEITDLFEVDNSLFIHQPDNLLMMPTTSESLQANGTIINIGLGDYLSLPFKRVGNMNYNYGGNQGRFNRFVTNYGNYFVNQKQGIIYNLNQGLEEISADMSQWFVNNLPSKLNEYWKATFKTDYPFLDSVCYDFGVGVQTTADISTDRLIIHKKDFVPLLPVVTTGAAPGKLYWNGARFLDEELNIARFENKNYFKNESFTVSYDMVTKSWISFHSYQPDWMFQDGNTFYSQSTTLNESNPQNPIRVKNIWSHNGNINSYYEVKYPSVVEWQVSKELSILNSIYYYARFQELQSGEWVDVFEQFDKGFVYNSYQTTLMFDLNTTENYLWQDQVKNVKTRDNIHHINGFRQLNASTKVLTKDWSVLKNSYNSLGQGYEPYTVINQSYTQNHATQYVMKDVFANARLYFTSPSNVRLRFQNSQSDVTKFR